MEEFCIVLGIVIAYWITYGTKFMAGHWSWRLPFLLQMIPGFILLAGVAMLPFSPRWLAAQGRESEALQNLAKLRAFSPTDRRVRQEFFDIICEVRYQKEASAKRHPQWQDGSRKSAIMMELIS
jgi:MFS family permease